MACIAIDCMGGDIGINATLPAAKSFLDHHPAARIILVGDESSISSHAVGKVLLGLASVSLVHAPQTVAMDEAPASAVKNKRQSSMRFAIEQVKSGAAQACLSAGNTGALMATARLVLRTVPGIDRPAIATDLPNQKGGATLMLDLGANVDCTAEHLLQFGIMGSALAKAMKGIASPSIGLLNIGEEVMKGNEVVKQASEMLRASDLNFFGNVEGNDVFKGTTDVVVCDGFVGNVALKTTEGVAQMLGAMIKEEFGRNLLSKMMAFVALPVLKKFKNRVDHRRYNGAALIGLNGIVFKSHGSADIFAFENALSRAYEAAEHDLIGQISKAIASLQASQASLVMRSPEEISESSALKEA
jgi:phosphate acyltransferase